MNHIFVSRFANGAWGTGQQADVGLADPSQFPHVAAGNGGRVVVTFVNKPVAGLGNLRAALAPNSASGFTVGSPDATTDTLVSDSDVAMDPVSGVAYTVFTAANMGGDVHAARLSGTTWTAIAPVLDDVQADDAGGTGRDTGARMAVDSAGNAVAAWPEKDAGMNAHVFVRRITGTTPATSDVEASIATLDGHADAQASADHVDIDGGDTASPWVVFRQMFVVRRHQQAARAGPAAGRRHAKHRPGPGRPSRRQSDRGRRVPAHRRERGRQGARRLAAPALLPGVRLQP